ncbi:MAG: hypothetical protein QF609_07345, partial [Gammaproteobacteria bacterium]|nr:hypothetical protein [Gammaproteobacteria bacterium]
EMKQWSGGAKTILSIPPFPKGPNRAKKDRGAGDAAADRLFEINAPEVGKWLVDRAVSRAVGFRHLRP